MWTQGKCYKICRWGRKLHRNKSKITFPIKSFSPRPTNQLRKFKSTASFTIWPKTHNKSKKNIEEKNINNSYPLHIKRISLNTVVSTEGVVTMYFIKTHHDISLFSCSLTHKNVFGGMSHTKGAWCTYFQVYYIISWNK